MSGAEGANALKMPTGFARAAALLVPALLFLLTLYGGLGGRVGIGDAVKFQFVGYTLSVPHEPGYPQYVLLSYLWTRLVPLPLELATRVNLLSTVFALVAGSLAFGLVRRLTGSAIAAVGATWVLLLSRDIWTLATQAEVYTLNLAWVAAVLYCAVRWRQEQGERWLVAMMFCYALSFGNHLLMITLLPALIVFVFLADSRAFLKPRLVGAGAAAIALGLSQYFFLWWRSHNPLLNMLPRFPRDASFGEVLRWSVGGHFTEQHFLASGLAAWPGRLLETWAYAFTVLTPIAVPLAIAGFVVLWRRDRALSALLVVAALGVTGFASAYEIRSWPYYCFPAWLAVLVFGAVGAAALWERAPRWRVILPVTVSVFLALQGAGTWAFLHAAAPPYDSAAAIAAAPRDAIIVPALAVRTAHNLGHYYTATLDLDPERTRFMGVHEVGTHPDLSLLRPVYAQSVRHALLLRRSGFEEALSPVDETAEFAPRTYRPITEVRYSRLDDATVGINLRDAGERVDYEPSVFVTILRPDARNSRATLRWATDEDGEWLAKLALSLRRVQRRESVLVLGLQLSQDQRRALGPLLAGKARHPLDLSAAASDLVVAFERHAGAAPQVFELDDEVTVALPLATAR